MERVTRGEHGGDGSTCDSGGRGSWWLSGAASVEGGWGGEREERDVLGWRSVFPVGRCVLPSWYGGRWCENPVCASYPVLGALVSYGHRSARVSIFFFRLLSVFLMISL